MSHLLASQVRIRKTEKGLLLSLDSVSAKIYSQKSRGYDIHTLTYYEAGKRVRRGYGDLEKAKTEGIATLIALAKGQGKVLELENADRDAYVRAMEFLAPLGIAIDTAAKEYAAAVKILKDQCGVLEAARIFMAEKKDRITSKLVGDIVKELVEVKKQDRKSDVYLKDLGLRLAKFAEAFPVSIDSLETADLENWLRSLDVSPRTRNNFRNILITLFNYAKRRGYLSKLRPHAAEETDEATEDGGEIGIFTPTEIQTLLDESETDVRLFLALGAFAGIRTAELKRLEWQDVDLERGYIAVGRSKAKNRRRRLVPIQGNLKAWMQPLKKNEGSLIQTVRPEKSASELAEKHKVKWKHNGLRHSFCSYRIAQTQNVAQTSLEAGNSPAIIETNYKELVRPEQGEEWFAVAPKEN